MDFSLNTIFLVLLISVIILSTVVLMKNIKRLILCFEAMLAFSLPTKAQHRADRQHLEDQNSFSMIVLGDPQGYAKYDINQPIFELCTAWIADNIDQLNIRAVLCTGDIVEQNENITMNRKMLNQTSEEMWESASRAFGRLDNKVPYIISCGNHDYGYKNAECGITRFPDYFPFKRNSTWRNCLVADFPNRNGVVSLENAAFEFSSTDWGKILIITSEFAPRDEVLDWAKNLAAGKEYVDHKVIFLTHSYLQERNAKRVDNETYKITPRNWGQAVWEKLVYPSSNIDLVVCGHTGEPGEFEDAVAYRVDKNKIGKNVHQMMFNVQISGGGWEGNGGDGWLRILEFMPDGKTIKVNTYSPLFGISPSTKHLAHRTGACDQFEMVIE